MVASRVARRSQALSSVEGIGTRIRLRREELQWNKETLAQVTGMNLATVYRLENSGSCHMYVGMLKTLALALGVSMDFLAGMPPSPVRNE